MVIQVQHGKRETLVRKNTNLVRYQGIKENQADSQGHPRVLWSRQNLSSTSTRFPYGYSTCRELPSIWYPYFQRIS